MDMLTRAELMAPLVSIVGNGSGIDKFTFANGVELYQKFGDNGFGMNLCTDPARINPAEEEQTKA